MDETNTPKSKPSIGILATSTVNRNKTYVPENNRDSDSIFQNSLGLLSCINGESSRNEIDDENFLMENLDTQKRLANSVLARSSQVFAIPSKYFHADMSSRTVNEHVDESTISEGDLIQTPKNMSTPKYLKPENGPRASLLSESISHISEMLDHNSIDSVVGDFLKMSRNTSSTSSKSTFIPAENAASKLMADEMSWRKKHDIPVTSLHSIVSEIQDISSSSVGEFFRAKCDSISDFKTKSPPRHKPVPLVDVSQFSTNSEFATESQFSESEEPESSFKKTLSINTIQQMLADNQASPLTVIKKIGHGTTVNKEENVNSTQISKSGKLSILPSTNTSYSTVFTENHAINALSSSDKENHPLPIGTTSKKSSIGTNASQELPSSRSSSCLTSLSNGKLPLQSTKSELVWGCVKVDKCVTKEFLLRNTSSKTIRIQSTLSTYDFKIRKESRSDDELLSTCKFILHAHESRPFYVSFAPTKIGAAFDELTFSPLDPNLIQTKTQSIRLFGYGGYACAEFQNTTRDNTGKMWLSFGKIDNRTVMNNTFSIRNSGNISLFVYIKVQPKHFLASNSFKIHPEIFVLIPGEEKHVELAYTPNTKDIKVLKQALNATEATDVGKLEIISGAEVNRMRLRRLCRKCTENDIPVDNLTRILSAKIQGEIIPSDVKKFKESANAYTDILETFHHNEVILTVEQDPNQTLIADFTENSIHFQSLCGDDVSMCNLTTKAPSKSTHLEPARIILSTPNKIEDCLYLSSDAPTALGFEVTVSPRGLEIFPGKGVVLPGETEIIRVKYNDNVTVQNFNVYVSLGCDVHEAEVKILKIRNANRFLD